MITKKSHFIRMNNPVRGQKTDWRCLSMMISPESYYEFYLKGKSQAEIITAIRSIKRIIGSLKNTMEHPDYGKYVTMRPSENVQLYFNRKYLAKAIEALEQVGGTYVPTKAEEKVAKFDNNIDSIIKITFEIGGFSEGIMQYVIEIVGESAILHSYKWDMELEEKQMDKTEILSKIRELHMGEWRSSYTLKKFGYMVCDGTQWSLEIKYSKGARKAKYYGDNAYPYNFEKFLKIFQLEDERENEEE